MLRCTIELVPSGVEERARTIGMVEIGNDGSGNMDVGNYKVVLLKTPPFSGALKQVWRRGKWVGKDGDEEIVRGEVIGFQRKKRGPYDLLYRALAACGIGERNK